MKKISAILLAIVMLLSMTAMAASTGSITITPPTGTADGASNTYKIDDADEHVSDAEGAVAAFTGLANGTYTLVEKTVPAGYNKAADSTFTVAEGNYTAANLEQATTVVNNSGTELPSTGGMGTTLFYVVGSLMMAAAVVVLVAKKKVAAK